MRKRQEPAPVSVMSSPDVSQYEHSDLGEARSSTTPSSAVSPVAVPSAKASRTRRVCCLLL